ncbi:MAG: hypothetical protein WD598_00685 [Acidimicrobiia bacterium]
MTTVLVVVVLLLAGSSVASAARATAKKPAGAIPGAHECVPKSPADRGDATIPWKELSNPILGFDDHMIKDQTLRLINREWHLFYSERFELPAPGGIGHAVSTDLTDWATTEKQFPEQGSPDITRPEDGRYLITSQRNDPSGSEINQLVYQAATDPNGEWSAPAQLVEGEFTDERIIDAGLAHTKYGLFLLFKRGLHEEVIQPISLAYSPSGSPDGPWEILGEPSLTFAENFQFLVIGGTWHVLTTKIPVHIPTLYRLVGDPSDPQSWLKWKEVTKFEIPEEAWNEGVTPGITHETANSAHLCDARKLDGYWYLTYAGSTELETFEGRGHAAIGLARSKDLKKWEVPPG